MIKEAVGNDIYVNEKRRKNEIYFRNKNFIVVETC